MAEGRKPTVLIATVAAILLVAGGVIAIVLLKPPPEEVSEDPKTVADASKTKVGETKKEKHDKIDSEQFPNFPPKTEKLPAPIKITPKPKSKKTFPVEPPDKPAPKVKPKEPVGPKNPKSVDPKPADPKPNPKDKKPTPKSPFQNTSLSASEAKRVNNAIDRGVAFLKKSQLKDGAWPGKGDRPNIYTTGYAAFGGLTLLECDVPPDDPTVQRAAAYVRSHVIHSDRNYDVSTAILFLDRLGDPRDRPLIQSLAIRVLQSQTDIGMWHYDCKQLSAAQIVSTYTALLRFRRPADPGADPLADVSAPSKEKPSDAAAIWQKLKNLPYPELPSGNVISYADSRRFAKEYFELSIKVESLPDWGNNAVPRVGTNWEMLQRARGPERKKLINKLASGARFNRIGVEGDNSNSQFAILALWAARRHGVPTEYALRLSAIRYLVQQKSNGGWGYSIGSHATPAMTGTGLLGLALGYGVSEKAADASKSGALKKAPIEDPAIKSAFQAFGGSLGGKDLYYLWTVERVCVLYNLKSLNGNDWYRSGMKNLISAQSDDNGSWFLDGYTGSSTTIDTCFALLFLKRSNLVRDLSDNLRFQFAIPNPLPRD